jgi:protein SCO1/2
MLKDVGVSPRMGERLPMEVMVHDSDGRKLALRECFRGRPVIITPVYYRCPMLCGLELNGLVRSLRGMSEDAGDEFDIVTFSIDPREETELAARKKTAYLAQYGRDIDVNGWRFLTAEQETIDPLCEAIGFHATYNPATGQYAHAAAIVVATPDGVISRYFYGVEFAPRDLRLAVVEASQGKVGTLTDHVLLYCYAYDPTTGRYGLAIHNLVRAAGALTVVVMAVAISWMLWRERRSVLLSQRTEPKDFIPSAPQGGAEA